jgi:hypothetical protein
MNKVAMCRSKAAPGTTDKNKRLLYFIFLLKNFSIYLDKNQERMYN